MKPALLPVSLLQATVELLDVQLWVGAQVQHLPIEMFQSHWEGQSHRGVTIQMGKAPEDLPGSGDFSWAGQHQEAQGDMEGGGRHPVGRRGWEKGRELLLQLLETGEDPRGVGPKSDEVCGSPLRRPTAMLLISLLQRWWINGGRWTSGHTTLCIAQGGHTESCNAKHDLKLTDDPLTDCLYLIVLYLPNLHGLPSVHSIPPKFHPHCLSLFGVWAFVPEV